jgi:hypothetical protein
MYENFFGKLLAFRCMAYSQAVNRRLCSLSCQMGLTENHFKALHRKGFKRLHLRPRFVVFRQPIQVEFAAG